MKEGVGRFVKYITYPMWATATQMPDKYDLSKFPPADVIENVELLINDKATFHELPRKQGRRHRVIRTIIGVSDGGDNSVPGIGARDSSGPVPSGSDVPGIGEPKGDGRVERRRRRRVSPESVPSGTGPRVQTNLLVTESDQERTEQLRKTLQRPRKKVRKSPPIDIRTSSGVETVVVTETKEGDSTVFKMETLQEKALPTPEPTAGVETVAKRKRGRPRKEKT
jgi:hypothetical protein